MKKPTPRGQDREPIKPREGQRGWWMGSAFEPEYAHMNTVRRFDHPNGDIEIVWDNPYGGYQNTLFCGLHPSHADRIVEMMEHMNDAVARRLS